MLAILLKLRYKQKSFLENFEVEDDLSELGFNK
jgi:hypothetical protein